MAVSVASFNADLPVHGSRRQGIPPRKTGSDDGRLQHGLRSRILALVGFWEELKDCNTPRRRPNGIRSIPNWSDVCNAHDGNLRDLRKPYGAGQCVAVPPPTYEESLQDLPPDYTTSEALATVHCAQNVKDSVNGYLVDQKFHPCVEDSHNIVDLSQIEGIRSYAGKKAKQAAKKAQQAKWADSDNEENPDGGADGGDGGDNNGGGDGFGAGGDGGDPPGGGDGGDDDDWWNTGASKKKEKKKKKKNAWEEFEEEEKQKAEEEEEKKKAEEDAAAVGVAQADPLDDWGAFATVGKKSKKGKKGAEPDPPPPPPAPETTDLGASATADANPDDEWGGFSTGKKKKGGKKGKVRAYHFVTQYACSMDRNRLISFVGHLGHFDDDHMQSSTEICT